MNLSFLHEHVRTVRVSLFSPLPETVGTGYTLSRFVLMKNDLNIKSNKHNKLTIIYMYIKLKGQMRRKINFLNKLVFFNK